MHHSQLADISFLISKGFCKSVYLVKQPPIESDLPFYHLYLITYENVKLLEGNLMTCLYTQKNKKRVFRSLDSACKLLADLTIDKFIVTTKFDFDAQHGA